MASRLVRERVAAREGYEAALRLQLSSRLTKIELYREYFEHTPFAELYKRRRTLVRPEHWRGLRLALTFQRKWIRDPMTWTARGHSPSALLWSLVRHLHCRYAIAPFWAGEWMRPAEVSTARLDAFCAIGSGRSYYAASNTGELGILLSRRECHLLSNMHGARDLGAAARLAQVAACGGPRWLGAALSRTAWGGWFAEPGREARRSAAIKWMARQPDLQPADVPIVCRIVDHRRRLDLSGRTVASVRRLAADLPPPRPQARRPPTTPAPAVPAFVRWPASGLDPLCVRGKGRRAAWEIRELCTSAALASEGHALAHCVGTYTQRASGGVCSIWSLRAHGIPILTIEVVGHAILQIRGRDNRDPSPTELIIVARWARRNGLVLPA